MSNARFNQTKLMDVRHYGAVGDGVTDDSAAIQTAIDASAEVIFPPGTYYCNTPLTLTANLERNQRLSGYGATLTSGPGVTGALLTVSGGFSPYRTVVEGLAINHRGNASAGGGVRLVQTTNAVLRGLSFALHGNKAGYTAISVEPSTPGVDDTNSFWTTIEHCSFRPHSGGDGTVPDYCIRLRGAANATTIRSCNFSTGNKGVAVQTDGVGDGVCNGLLLEGNWFEGMGTAISVEATPGNFWPPGMRVIGNRGEALTTWASFTTGGAAANNHSQPPLFVGNYVVAGSITNYILNTTGAYLTELETSFYGDVLDQREYVNGSKKLRLGGNLEVGNLSGTSGYSNGHVVLGAYHLWVESATGKLRLKASAPTADDDGTVVGTQT